MALALFALSAYDTVITVKSDGSGDYTNIAAAVASVQTSAIIYVYGPTTYNGTANKNISWNGTQKTIKIQGINNPVIDCEDSGCAFTIDYATQDDIIQGVSIINGNYYMPGGAIRIKDGCAQIIDCNFTNCHVGTYSTTFQMSPWTISRGGAIFIEHANSQQSSLISGNTFTNCVAWEGGAVCVETGFSVISQNSFTNCHACWSSEGTGDSGEGGAVYLKSSSTADISENSFTGNTSPCCGSAISSSGVGSDIFQNTFDANYRSDYGGLQASPTVIANDNSIHHNVFKNHVYDISHGFSLIETDECYSNTFINNSTYTNAWNGVDCTYKNCIFNNNNLYLGGITAYANYCLFYNCGTIPQNVVLSNCIENSAPQLDANYTPLWNATTKSVCIDAGDPSILDADGTPSDIGAVSAVEHRYDEVDLPSLLVDNGWKWLSFPSLDVVLNDADLAGNVLDDILDPTILDVVLGEDIFVQFTNNQWQDTNEQFLRTEGYKFHMNAAATLDVPGFKVPDNTTIALGAGDTENWVGYWLDETQSVQDAFGSYWDGGNIYSVKHQKWSAYRSHGEWKFKVSAGYENPTLSYGDMVEIKCTTGISNFGWDNSTPEDRAVTFAEPTIFSYEEQADYLPLFIQLDEDDMPQEIGAFVGDICIGAAVVETDEVQINAYVGSAPAGNIELQFSYGGRAADKRINQFNCVELSDSHHVLTNLPSRSGGDAYFINLRDGQAPTSGITTLAARNYPNPFNPETTISYSLPQDGLVCVKVFNSRGQLVTTLVDGEQPSGVYNVTWKGTDAAGNSVSSGIYFYRVTAGNKTINRKMLLLK